MDIDDLEPRSKKPQPKKLDEMAIDELGEYLAELEAEAERVRAEIAGKKDYLEGAQSFFKS
ncbi:MAG: DUF1192 domain-containing protein [Kiloniellales bacterium]